MKKKINLLTVTVLSTIIILLLFGIKKNDDKESDFNSLIKTKEDINSICKSRTKISHNLIDKISFDGNYLFFDDSNDNFYYSLIENSATSYNPTVKYDGDVNIVFNSRNITDELIENNISIEMVVYSENEYNVYNLFCTTLPLMNINVRDINAFDALANEGEEYAYQKMKLQLFDNEETAKQRLFNYEGKIKIRGKGTAVYDKKGFKLTLFSSEVEKQKQQTTSLLNLREGNEYVLYAGFNDYEKIRNVFSSKLWYISCAKNNSLAIDNGMYYKYIELFVNNEYYGLYALGFPIDEIQENIVQNKNSEYQIENIYKKANPIYCEKYFDFLNLDKNGYNIISNDGYGSFIPLSNLYFDLLNKNIDNLIDEVDINNSIDIFLFNNLVQNVDCIQDGRIFECQSLYNLYIISKDYDNKTTILYCPWDLDRTWGEGFDNEVGYDISYDHNSLMEYNLVYLLLQNNDNSIKTKIKQRYYYLRNNEWSNDNIISILCEYEHDIFDSGAFCRDEERWPSGYYIERNIKLSNFKEYVIARLEYCDIFINEKVG